MGCGIGLISLMLNYRTANITATDYHPAAEHFLLENVLLNKGKKISFVPTGWGDEEGVLGEFDLIVAPGRSYHGRFSKKMVTFGYSHSYSKPLNVGYLKEPFRGQILSYER